MNIVDKLVVADLTDEEQRDLNELLAQLARRSRRNTLRENYYDAEAVIEHLGIAIPPALEQVSTVVGWPAKAVTALEHRINWDGWVLPNGDVGDLGLDKVYDDNNLAIEATEAHTTALKFGCSFVAVLAGDPEYGEPEVVVRNLSPRTSTVLWDSLRRRARTALTITELDGGTPVEFILFTADAVLTCIRMAGGRYAVHRQEHSVGRCPVAVLRFQPSVERPLGRSRITRPVMAITDRVIRTILRMEVGGEFYLAPRSVLLGADSTIFDGVPGWATYLSRLQVVPLNEVDQAPTLQHMPQMTMTPHIEMLRSDAGLFAGETDIPVHLLGVIHDNPASDAAMHTSYLELVKTAERAAAPFGAGWADVARLAVMVREGLDEVPEELQGIRANFSNPATPTLAAAADAAIKLVDAGILPAESDVTLELVGMDATTIERVKTDRRRASGGATLAGLLAAAGAPQAPGVQPPAAGPQEAPPVPAQPAPVPQE